jgi:hypothetical protein
MEKIDAATVAETIRRGGIVYPYPRRGEVSINGGRRKPATLVAVRLAVDELKRQRAAAAPGAGWTLERVAEGRYHVRAADGHRVGGIIIGGRRRWTVEHGGCQWSTVFPSARAAGAALAEYHAVRGRVTETATGAIFHAPRADANG